MASSVITWMQSFHSHWAPKSTFSQPFKEKCIRDVVRIGCVTIFYLSKLWKAKFSILCDVIFLVRLQGKFVKLITVGSERVKPGGLDLSLGPLYWQFPTYMFQCDKGLLVSWQVDDVFERWPGDRTPCGLSRVIRPRPCQQICECAVAISGIIITSPDAATRTGLKPWLNGTPSSSQVTESKLASAGGQTEPPSQACSHSNHSIVWKRPRSHITMTKQLGESWLRWPNGGKRGSSWAKIWAWSNSSQLYPTRANSSQVGGQTIPNSIEVVNLAELAWVGRTVWSGAITAALLHANPMWGLADRPLSICQAFL